jgi:hypothetical protein
MSSESDSAVVETIWSRRRAVADEDRVANDILEPFVSALAMPPSPSSLAEVYNRRALEQPGDASPSRLLDTPAAPLRALGRTFCTDSEVTSAPAIDRSLDLGILD